MAWNGSDGALAPKVEEKKSPAIGKGLIAGLIVVVLALAAWFAFLNPSNPASSKEDESASKAIADATPSLGHDAPIPEVKNVKKTATSIAREYNDQAKEFIKKSPTNEVVWLNKPIDPNDPDYALHSQVAMEIRTLLAVTPGDPMPPVPFSFMQEDDAHNAIKNGHTDVKVNDGTDDFLKLIHEHAIVEKKGDDEAALNRKVDFLNVQDELLAGINEGLSVNDSIRAAYEFRQRAHELRTQIIAGLREYVDAGESASDMSKTLQEMNNKLTEEGIRTISASEIGINEEEVLYE